MNNPSPTVQPSLKALTVTVPDSPEFEAVAFEHRKTEPLVPVQPKVSQLPQQDLPQQAHGQLNERTARAESLPTLVHDEFGKMSETTSHWVTWGHPAFKRRKDMPEDADAVRASETLSAAPHVWVVTEKIHGSNFSFVCLPPKECCQNPVIYCAKRGAILDDANNDDNETFYGYRKIKQAYQQAAEKAYRAIALQFSGTADSGPEASSLSPCLLRLTIYGELFGGIFPGLPSPPDVIKGVQEGIYYHPDLQFMVYGASVRIPTEIGDKRIELDFLNTMDTLKECGFLTLEPLAVGSFSDCCNFDVNFVSQIPNRLGVDPSAREKIAASNMAEGVVCRTNVAQTVPVVGDKHNDRCMFKRKRAQFASYCAKNAAEISDQLAVSARGDKKSFLEFVQQKVITDELISSAFSKEGTPTTRNRKSCNRVMEKVTDHVLQDVTEAVSQLNFSDAKASSISETKVKGKEPSFHDKSHGKSHSKGRKKTVNQKAQEHQSDDFVSGISLVNQYLDDLKQSITFELEKRIKPGKTHTGKKKRT